jgi:hypothetical protein
MQIKITSKNPSGDRRDMLWEVSERKRGMITNILIVIIYFYVSN